MPWKVAGGTQVVFRNYQNNVKIMYSASCTSFQILGEKTTPTKVQERCYAAIAESFAHLARFYTAETSERGKMIKKEKKFQEDMKTGANAYEELLKK